MAWPLVFASARGSVILLCALTGGFGLLVPRIEGLGGCDDQFGRLLWAALIGISVVPFLAVCCAVGNRRRFGKRLVAIWPLAVMLNVALGHDPVCAVLNWRIDRTAFEQTDDNRHWQIVTPIANHEQVIHTPEAGFFVGRGA